MSRFQHQLERLSEPRRLLLAHWLDALALSPRSAEPLSPESIAGPRVRQPLVAYVTSDMNAGEALDPAAVRDYLRDRLPDYMVPHQVVALDALPRMPNGKVDVKTLAARNSADSIAEHSDADTRFAAPTSPIEQTLAEIWSELIGVEIVGIHDNFFDIGGDSIVSIQVISRAREAGIQIEPRHMVDHPTIAELAAAVAARPSPNCDDAHLADFSEASGVVPLTPIQHWFFALDLTAPHHWNQAAVYEVSANFDSRILSAAVRACAAHHDALRMSFHHRGERWRAAVAPASEDLAVHVIDFVTDADDRQLQAVQHEVAAMQADLDLGRPPLLRLLVARSSVGGPCQLVIVAHHLIVDAISWPVLITDLHHAYERLESGAAPSFPDATTPYAHWARTLARYAESTQIEAERGYWLTPPPSEAVSIPTAGRAPDNSMTEATARTETVCLPATASQALLTKVHDTHQTRINDLLLAALVLAFARWTGRTTLRVGVEGHGRTSPLPGLDVSRTVGWFTSFYPLNLSVEDPQDIRGVIRSIKEQLRAVPGGGIGYGVLRYLRGDAQLTEAIAAQPRPEVLFNYLGKASPWSDPTGWRRHTGDDADAVEATSRDPRNAKTHVLEINAAYREERLHIDWIYSDVVHRRTTIAQLAADFLTALESLITHCLTADAPGFTPSDFAAADLNQQELDDFLDSLD